MTVMNKSVWSFKVWLSPLLFIKILFKAVQFLSNYFPSSSNPSIKLFHHPHKHLLHYSQEHSPIACTIISHTYSHFISYLHYTKTTTSSNNTSNLSPTTSADSPTATSVTTSMTTVTIIIFPKKPRPKMTNKPAHIIILKRHAPIFTKVRLKRHNKSLLQFKNHKTSLITHPATISKFSTSTSTTTTSKTLTQLKDVTFHQKKITPKQSTSTTDKKNAPTQTTLTPTINTITTTQTKIPALMQINISLLFMYYAHTHPPKPYLCHPPSHPSLYFPTCCRKSSNQDSEDFSNRPSVSAQGRQNYLVLLKTTFKYTSNKIKNKK